MTNAAENFHIQCLDIQGWQQETQRWLADSLYLAANEVKLRHFEWYTSKTSTPSNSRHQPVIVLAATSVDSPTVWPEWWQAAQTRNSGETLGMAPSAVSVSWQAGYERVCFWRR